MSYYVYHGSKKSRNNRGRQAAAPKKRGPKKDYIHPSKFVQAAKPVTVEKYEPTHKFTDFALEPFFHVNIAKMGLTDPTPIQDKAIPAGLDGRDIVGIANTGTGKTAAFVIPVLQKLEVDQKAQAIILAPTRELAQQIEQQCFAIGNQMELDHALLIGGVAMGPQLRQLRYNPRLIIGTPGRIKDHLERGTLKLDRCNIVVLDEVDRMLDMGFVHDITQILNAAQKERQSFYFSATMDARVSGIINTFSHDPLHISVKAGQTSANVEQDVVRYSHIDQKIDLLHDTLITDPAMKAVIFDDTHRSVEKLTKELVDRGFAADSLHGGKTQGQRARVLQKFKDNQVKLLVATDVAARGLDIADITHVINYSLPQTYDDYVHRIGRTGRADRVGMALTFIEA